MKIQKAKNPDNLTSFEQKHLPWIIIPEFVKKDEEFKITVKVGKVDHPMTDEHYIRGIQLCINKKCFKRVLLNPADRSEAKFKISLEKDSVITARAECNLHGVWEAKEKVVLYRGNNDK
ncbi:class II SORL domain-containing protein [Candidatus Parcubacteria bacterium]|nr:class II SORL domain-containing protein [Candidatus Parcubacteria bacterium]